MQTIMITGANRGIGLELVKQFDQNENQVIACCRQPQSAEELLKIADKSKGRVELYALDVTRSQDIDALKKQIGTRPVDILINNAGISDGRGGQVDYDLWEEIFRVNTIAPYRISTTFHDNLCAGNQKKIAVISSKMGSIALNDGGRPAYRSSKAAVNLVMMGLAKDYHLDGIAVFMLHPGWVRTDLGGPSAPVPPEESAAGLKRVIEQLSFQDSGKFIDYQGQELPW